MIFLSAKTGQRVENLFDLIKKVHASASMRITTGNLNAILAEATARVQPPTDKGRRLKIYYITQAGIQPPTFVCFCNDAKLFHYSYVRYLEKLREYGDEYSGAHQQDQSKDTPYNAVDLTVYGFQTLQKTVHYYEPPKKF